MALQLVLALRDASLDTSLKALEREGQPFRGKTRDATYLCSPFKTDLNFYTEPHPPLRPFIPEQVGTLSDVYSPHDQLLLVLKDDSKKYLEVVTWENNDENTPLALFLKHLLRYCDLQEAKEYTLVHQTPSGESYQSKHELVLALPTAEGRELLNQWWQKTGQPAWQTKSEDHAKEKLAKLSAVIPQEDGGGSEKRYHLLKVTYEQDGLASFVLTYSAISPRVIRWCYQLRLLPPFLFLLMGGSLLWLLVKAIAAPSLFVGGPLFLCGLALLTGTAVEGGWVNSSLVHTKTVFLHLFPKENPKENILVGKLCQLAYSAQWTRQEPETVSFKATFKWQVKLSPAENAEVLSALFPKETGPSLEVEHEAAVRELQWRRKFS